MGCKTEGYKFDVCSGFSINSQHCYYYTAPSGTGATFSFVEYPEATIRQSGGYNIPDREENRVMYPFTAIQYGAEGPGAANCGKVTLTDSCTQSFSRDSFTTPAIVLDYVPNQLSFDYGYSDTWFAYLYDTSDNAGNIGTACYYIETESRTTSTTVTPGEGSSTPGSTGSTDEPSTRCIPCTSYSCTAASTTVRYTGSEDLTGDPDCPHPTLFGIGTTSKKLVFSYNQLSTQIPDGVLSFEVSDDGVTYVDAWDPDSLTGISYTSSENPWGAGDEAFSDFEVYTLDDGVNAIDFRVKFRIEPIFDDTVTPTSFTGTSWRPTEILSNGTGFSVGDVFTLTYDVRLADNSLTTLTLYLRVKEVGNVPGTQQVEGLDLLRPGDTLNGHTVTRAFHTELGLFPYHIVYVDGSGNDFVKDTQYTSDRDHIVTAVAGYGIPDRAILIGLYEFLQKSIQFLTGDVLPESPDVKDGVVEPLAFLSVDENGRITDVNLSGGVYSFDSSSLYALNEDSVLSGYSNGDNVATSGGTGSGLTVDIRTEQTLDDSGNVVFDGLKSVIVNTCGSGYTVGDEITISGGSAKISVAQVTNGGQNLDKLEGGPDLGVTSPTDNGTALQKTSTDDGEAPFVLFNDGGNIDFEVVTTEGGPSIEPVSAKDGGNNETAKLDFVVSGGVLTSVKIIRGGKGYTTTDRPDIVVENMLIDNAEQVPNAARRDDLVGEFQGILKDLPPGDISASAGDLNAIENVYSEVPKTRTNPNIKPKFDIKMDPDRERVNQLQQYKLSADATEPLKSIIVPDYDVNYLDGVDVPSEYKQVVRDDLQRSKDTVNQNIDDITQEKIPEYRVGIESKVESCSGSFTNLPEASQFTKYIMRQYRPDPSKSTSIQVQLSCTPVNEGCAHITCPPPAATVGGTTTSSETDETTGDTTETSTTTSYTMSALLGPGCQSWTASGTLKIWHDLSRDARTVSRAAKAQGNPFAN